jgi:hypothetical protein
MRVGFTSEFDAVDGSSTGTSVPSKWVLLGENLARIPVDLSQIEPRSKASSIVRPNGPKIDRIPWSSVPRAAFLFSATPALFPYADPMWIAFLRLVTFLQRMVGAFNYSGAVVICLPYMRRRRRSSVRYHSFIWLAWIRLNC